MSGDAEYGKCECCGKYYHYDFDCDCCVGPQHFEMVRHCGDSEPKLKET